MKRTIPGSIDEILRNITSRCFDYINQHLNNQAFDVDKVDEFLKKAGLNFPPPDGDSPNDIIRHSKDVYGSFIKSIFSGFNEQCSWQREIVNASTSSISYDTNATQTSFALDENIKPALLNCIYNALVRDFGSHPFSRVSRAEISRGNNANTNALIGVRSVESDYSAYEGLPDIVTSSVAVGANGRFTGQLAFAGLIHEKPQEGKFATYEPIAESFSRSNRICKDHGLADGSEFQPKYFGVTGGFQKYQVVPSVEPDLGLTFLVHLICHSRIKNRNEGHSTNTDLIDGFSQIPIGLFRFIKTLSDRQKNFSYSVQPSGVFDLEHQTARQALSGRNLLDQTPLSFSIGGETQTSSERIEKKYRVVGYGGQGEDDSTEITLTTPEPDSKNDNGVKSSISDSKTKTVQPKAQKKRVAEFGWYIFPASKSDGFLSRPTLESANVKLTAQISLPAWWDRVDLIITKSWLDPDHPEKPNGPNDPLTTTTLMRVDLPTRLEFIRNHFPDAFSIQPTLYQLQIPRVELLACQKANIILKGERLWRSTVVTLGGQKANSIEVMPNMGGIIAEFERVLPNTFFSGDKKGSDKVPVTIWTSEGEQTVVDSVKVTWPTAVQERLKNGSSPCSVDQSTPKEATAATSK